MLSRAPSRTVPAAKVLVRRSPQLRLSSSHRGSRKNLAGAPLFARPTTAAPESAATPPLPTAAGTPPLHHQSSTTPKTTGLFSSGTPLLARPYTTSATSPTILLTSSRPNSFKISASRTAQIARHLSGSSSSTSTTSNMAYTTRKVAAPYTLEHRVYIEKDGVPVSPFHDIPLFANQEQTILNMVVEIPRWTNAKLEVSSVDAVMHYLFLPRCPARWEGTFC